MSSQSWAQRLLLWYGAGLPDHPGKWRLHYLLRRWLGVEGKGSEQEVVRQGMRWVLSPADYVQSDVFWLGSKDKWELFHLEKLVSPGAVILDVGANFGYYGLILARHLGSHCQVYSFEPNPETWQRLNRHIQMNGLEGSVTALALGVGAEPGTAGLAVPQGNTGASHLEPGGGGIQVTSLDAFAAEKGLTRLDLIKMDVEGLEPQVLAGGRETLSRFKPAILAEVNPPALARAGSTPEEMLAALRGLGYRLFEPRRKELIPLESPPEGEDYVNVLALPD